MKRILIAVRDPQTDSIHESKTIHAPIARVFALSTRIELVRETLGMNLIQPTPEEEAAGCLRSGHITAAARVHWFGWKFGLPTHHHTLITGFQAPQPDPADPAQTVAFFQDSQEKGRFAFFQHDHHFRQTLSLTGEPITTLRDEVRFTLPFGPLGRLVAAWIVAPHVRRLCRMRFARIQALAESEDAWRAFVDPAAFYPLTAR